MKKILLVIGLAVILSACNKEREDTANPLPLVIKQTNDERGLISVVFVEGRDTLGFDYLTPSEYFDFFKVQYSGRLNDLIKTNYVCPDCLEWGCIYEDIDTAIEGEGTDTDIYNAVMYVIKERGITDTATIKLLLANYYL